MKLAEQILEKNSNLSLVVKGSLSESVNNRELLSLAYMTSEEGKLTNKKVHDYISKQVRQEDVDALPKKGIALDPKKLSSSLEDNNFHTLSLVVDLLAERKTKHAEFALEVEKLHDKMGHLPSWLSTLRFLADVTKKNNGEKFRERMIKEMEKTTKKIGGRFGTGLDVSNKDVTPSQFWALLKNHPEKDIIARIEELKNAEPIRALHLTVTYKSSDKKERMSISNSFYDLARKINRDKKDSDVHVEVNGPFTDGASAKFGA